MTNRFLSKHFFLLPVIRLSLINQRTACSHGLIKAHFCISIDLYLGFSTVFTHQKQNPNTYITNALFLGESQKIHSFQQACKTQSDFLFRFIFANLHPLQKPRPNGPIYSSKSFTNSLSFTKKIRQTH